jgi:CheY-like chemotaxis protein
MGKVLALVDDLFFRARIADTARHLGVDFEAAASPEALVVAAAADGGARASLIVIDLNAGAGFRAGGPPGAVPAARSRAPGLAALELLRAAGNQTPVVAFLSHVQVDLAERARAAGADEVLPRSKFTQNLAEILARAGS